MEKEIFIIRGNREIAPSVFEMRLEGNASGIRRPGQFVNIAIEGLFLRRPISVCDWDEGYITIIYKVVGEGTRRMSLMREGERLDILTGLGNGFNSAVYTGRPLLVGGGVGVPPLYALAKKLIGRGKEVSVVLGFNTAAEVFYKEEFEALGAKVIVSTVDGSMGVKGFVTDAISAFHADADYFFACGPLPMLDALRGSLAIEGQLSYEERMGCGFGACMGCSMQTRKGAKRVCKEGPVFLKSEIL